MPRLGEWFCHTFTTFFSDVVRITVSARSTTLIRFVSCFTIADRCFEWNDLRHTSGNPSWKLAEGSLTYMSLYK